jgi:hypothetical protein
MLLACNVMCVLTPREIGGSLLGVALCSELRAERETPPPVRAKPLRFVEADFTVENLSRSQVCLWKSTCLVETPQMRRRSARRTVGRWGRGITGTRARSARAAGVTPVGIIIHVE